MPAQSIQSVMSDNPACCTPQDSIKQVARIMLEEDCGAVPVVESGQSRRLVGMITDRDIVVRLIAEGQDVSSATVQQAMSDGLSTLGPGADIQDCMQLMAERQVRRVPVIDNNGRLLGIVAQADLARASARDESLEDDMADTLEEISAR